MKKLYLLLAAAFCMMAGMTSCSNVHTLPFGDGTLTVTPLQDNAVRIRYAEGEMRDMPELVYEDSDKKVRCKVREEAGKTVFQMDKMCLTVDPAAQTVTARNADGETVFTATAHELKAAQVQGEATREARLEIASPQDEYL